MVFAPEKWSL